MSSLPSTAGDLVIAQPGAARRGHIGLYLELTKARLSAMVLLTTLVGFILADLGPIRWPVLCWTLLGTALAAGCANSFNQIIEVNRDRLMRRTRNRPLPSRSISMRQGVASAAVMGIAGVGLLAALVNIAAAALALATILTYVFIYTPLKVRSTLNTFVGAICGAIPPMIGWVAASGGDGIESGAWVLGAILFVWQLPHFLALAWLYRDDYARGGFAMLPVIDGDGRITCQAVVLTCSLLLPLGMLATLMNLAGFIFAIGSLVLGGWMLVLCIRLYLHCTDANARAVFLASLAYLPLLMSLMVIDRGPA